MYVKELDGVLAEPPALVCPIVNCREIVPEYQTNEILGDEGYKLQEAKKKWEFTQHLRG